ncbi:MAG TPA: sugar-binding protein [Gammaproteobacteria bacterium]|nr:sugar-binding protein [Gammaproteobacteria bacterium]
MVTASVAGRQAACRIALYKTIVTACVLLIPITAPFAQPEPEPGRLGGPAKSFRAQRASAPPTIDGVLNEEIWLRAPVIDDLHQVNPVEFGVASERTEVRVLYDRDALYVAARLYDSEPSEINARVLRQNQPIGSDDRFFIHIDPYNTRRSGYLFGVNANGVRFDGVYEGTTQRQFDWDGIWQAAATVDEEGWTVEIEIPFKTISFDPATDIWRVNFARNIERRNESIAWVSQDRRTDLSTMGDMRGVSQIEQGRGLDVIPTANLSDRRAFANVTAESDFQPSVDAFYKVTPQLNASLTVNTDFSATEVDDRQVNLTRFSLFFPERRDFFLQDVDIFQFGRLQQDGRPFFSRRLGISATGQEVPLDFGGKLSGRIGRFELGALAVRQDSFEEIDATTAFVARVAANVLDESSVGMILTNGDPGSNDDNSVFGADFRYFKSGLSGGRSLEAEAWLQQSDSEGLTGDDMAAGFAMRAPSSEGWNGEFGISRIEQNFNPALGFVRRTGIEQRKLDVGYTWRPSGGAIRTISTSFDVDRIDYLDNGEIQSESTRLQLLNIELDSQDGFNVNYDRDREGLRFPFEISPGIVIDPGEYSFDSMTLGYRAGNQRAISGGLFLNDGDFFDGERSSVNVFLNFRPSRHFRTNLRYQYNEIDLPGGSFETRVVQLTLEGVFSSSLAWTNLIQYDNVSETIGINSRLHWVPRAGREGYLVLNHNLQDLDRDNNYHSSFSETTIKYSYTFRF